MEKRHVGLFNVPKNFLINCLGLPAGTVITGCSDGTICDCITFRIEHPDLRVVWPGGVIPNVEALYKYNAGNDKPEFVRWNCQPPSDDETEADPPIVIRT